MKVLTPLLLEGPRRPGSDLIRRHAEGLAYELCADRTLERPVVALAIERAIRRFAGPWREQHAGPTGSRCPRCGEEVLIEWDPVLRHWHCTVCVWTWRGRTRGKH